MGILELGGILLGVIDGKEEEVDSTEGNALGWEDEELGTLVTASDAGEEGVEIGTRDEQGASVLGGSGVEGLRVWDLMKLGYLTPVLKLGKRLALSCQLELIGGFLALLCCLKEGLGRVGGLDLELELVLVLLGLELELGLELGYGLDIGLGLRLGSGLEVGLAVEILLGEDENLTVLVVHLEIVILPDEMLRTVGLEKIHAYFSGIEILNLDTLPRLPG